MIKYSCIIILLICLFSCKKNHQNQNNSRVDRLPFYNEATFKPNWVSEKDKSLDTFHQISSFKFVNQDGKIITNQTFKNKIYVTDFFFTSCAGICPKMTSNMKIVQDEFLNDDDVLLLSHSVTPEADSVSVLKEYAKHQGVISDKWHLITGLQKDIYKLGRKDYFIEENLGLDKDENDFLHTENFVLIDKNRHIRGIYNGLNKTSINQLIKDIHTLKTEK
jgi:protein SCO1/2